MKTPKQSSSLQYKLKNNDILYFLHIPKTAGTTFATVLENFFDYQSIYPEKLWHDIIRKNQVNFSNIRLIRGHFGYGIHRILSKKPIYSTILRDPFERAISSVEHRKRDPDPRFLSENKFLGKTLDEILETPDVKYYWNAQTDYIGIDVDVMKIIKNWDKKAIANFDLGKQMKFIREKTSPKKLVSSAKKNLSQFHFVGLAEKFQESLFLLCYTFGWRPIRSNWKLNVSPKRAHKNDLTPNQLNKVNDAISFDLKLYEFGKELFESRFSQMVHELEEKYFEPSFANLPFREMMFKMLEKNYETRLHKSRMIPVKLIDYDFRQKLSGTGWYWREFLEEKGNVFRWTGPETTSTIDFTLNTNHDLIIQFRVIREIVPGLLKSLKLKVNDHAIEIKKIEEKSGNSVFEGFIPKSVLMNKKHFTRLCFEIDRTINPHEVNSSDPTDRPLGIAVDKIKIMPSKEYAVDKIKILPSKEYAETRDGTEISLISLFSKKNLQGNADVARLRRRTNKWNRYWRKKGLLFF